MGNFDGYNFVESFQMELYRVHKILDELAEFATVDDEFPLNAEDALVINDYVNQIRYQISSLQNQLDVYRKRSECVG